jgi:hypothetical protein
MLELKEHIQNNHMDLCIETIFVTVRNLPAKQGAQPFNYLLCTLCGNCFSQVFFQPSFLSLTLAKCFSQVPV